MESLFWISSLRDGDLVIYDAASRKGFKRGRSATEQRAF
jgi:hypothetical protein